MYKNFAFHLYQVYCRACSEEYYRMELSSVSITNQVVKKYETGQCLKCPYGAKCSRGIVNNAGFWGEKYAEKGILMHSCPKVDFWDILYYDTILCDIVIIA